jgi:uncharacterized protein YbaR (Trm112 family)
MKRELLPLLRCPMDRDAGLELIVFAETAGGAGAEVLEGALVCRACGRWHAILDGVPHLVRDGLRMAELEFDLLRRHAAKLPPEASAWKPYGPNADW